MPQSALQPYKLTPAHAAHVALKATWLQRGEWRVPQSYGEPAREAAAVRAAVGLCDVSAMGKLDIKGRGVDAALDSILQALGNTLAVLRLKPGHALVLTEANGESRARERLCALPQPPSGCVHITDVTSALGAFAVVGPRADDLLSRLTPLDLRPKNFPYASCRQTDLAHVHATIYREARNELSRYLVLVNRDVGEYAWDTITHAGGKLGLTPFGAAAAGLLDIGGAERA